MYYSENKFKLDLSLRKNSTRSIGKYRDSQSEKMFVKSIKVILKLMLTKVISTLWRSSVLIGVVMERVNL